MKRTSRLLLLLALAFSSLAHPGHAQSVVGYELHRQEYFTQCTTNGPAPDTARSHYVAAYVTGSLTGGSVTWKTGNGTLTNSGSRFFFRQQLASSAPGGAYAFNIMTVYEGAKSQTINLAAPSKKVQPPFVRNLEAAQEIEPSQDFTLRWDPLNGAGPRDQFAFVIVDKNDQVLLDTDLQLNQTSVKIPAGTLGVNVTNRGYLFFYHVLSLSPPKAGKPYVLTLEIRTTRFSIATINPSGEFRFAGNQSVAVETDGSISIPVERSQTLNSVNLDYYVEGITALPDVNFAPTTGTLSFPAGVASQSIVVPLLNDGTVTAPLTARVWLENATGGATLPRRRSTEWTILDSEGPAGPNITAAVLAKVAFYGQTNSAPPDQLALCAPARFFTSIHPGFPGAIVNASVQLRNGSISGMTEPVEAFLEYNVDFPSRTTMDKVMRPGPYIMTVDTRDEGQRTFVSRMLREPAFPVPHLLNFNAAQSIDASAPFTLSWEPFTGATTNDVVVVRVADSSGDYAVRSPDALEAGAFSGTTTSFQIPANVLRPGEEYFVNIGFVKVGRTDNVSGVRSSVAFYHATGLYIKTAGTAVAKARAAVASDCCGAGSPGQAEPAPKPLF